MTRNSNTKIFTPFANPERQFQARKDTTPISVHNIYSFYESEPSDAEFKEIGEVDIETLTMEQYLALYCGGTRRGVRKPEIEGNVDFEIKGQFLRELRDNTFSGNENEDASLFNISGVSGDAIMLRVFPLTLTGTAKRWLERAPTQTINTWDLPKWIFILRFFPPSKTSKHLEEIHNFRQEGRVTLYQAWERYIDLLFKCLTHNLNDYQKDLQPILGLIATRALVTIQEMADHSHDEERTGEYNSTQISTITDKLKILNRNMQNLRENVLAIKGGYKLVDEMYYLSSEEVKFVKATKYREDNLGVTPGNNSPLRNNFKHEEIFEKYLEESCKRQDMFNEWMEILRDTMDKNLRRHDSVIKVIEENVARLVQAVKTHDKLN
ncbi:la-related protein 1B-like protein [Tanacetum coccineum]|uniref:La-related protein 1B-like protein n=1 Tax=Tanacetum coccineum TaxID=301880 RepID=A0ABQ4YD01_9ASTR